MPEETSGSQVPPSPGGKPMGATGITLVTLYLVAVTIVVFHSLVVLWPPNRERDDRLTRIEQKVDALTSGLTTDLTTDFTEEIPPLDTGLTEEPTTTDFTPETAATPEETETPPKKETGAKDCGDQTLTELFWVMPLCLSDEERLFLIVMFSGALGGLVHSLRSFYWYAGNRKLVLSWAGFYVTLPVLGATLATVFYVVVRGGFFSPQSEITDTSPFGFAALAALVGMFTEQAVEKLKKIMESTFADAPEGKDHAGPVVLTVSKISPPDGPQAGGTEVTITGKGFDKAPTVTFGGKAATDVKVAADGTSLTAKTPPGDALGAVDLEVKNPDGKTAPLAGGFTYV